MAVTARNLCTVIACFATVAASGGVGAAEPPKGAVVISGDKSQTIRSAVEARVGLHLTLLDEGDVRRTMAMEGLQTQPGPLVDDRFGGDVGSRLARLAQALDLRILIVGSSRIARGKRVVRLAVLDLAAKLVLADSDWPMGKRRRKPKRSSLDRLAAAVERVVSDLQGSTGAAAPASAPPGFPGTWEAEHPPWEAPSRATQQDDDREKYLDRRNQVRKRKDGTTGRPAGTHADSWFAGHVVFTGYGRRFQYNDVLSNNLLNYSSLPSMAAGVETEGYPLRWKTDSGQSRHLGLEFNFLEGVTRQATVQDSEGDGIEVSNPWRQWRVGPKMRFDFPWFLGDLSLTYNELRSTFSVGPGEDLDVENELPGVHYRGIRLGVGGRLEFSWLSFSSAAGMTFLVRGGHVGNGMFPNASKGMFDISLGASRHIFWGIEFKAGLTYTHVYYDLQPEPGDEFVAGGALDQYLTFTFGVGYVLSGDLFK